MKICGVDVGTTDTKYAYRKDGKIVCSYDKPGGDFDFGYTGVKSDSDAFPEFECVTLGACELTGLSDFLLVSMGTGTAFLRVKKCESAPLDSSAKDKALGGTIHLGGTGVGGGTIQGLYRLRNDEADVKKIAQIAENGNLEMIDLQLRDITENDSETLLPKDITVSNLHKLTKNAADRDFAAGIINLVAETILMMAVFARRDDEKIVCIGGLSKLDRMKKTAEVLGRLHKISFIFPENASFAGAIGCLIKKEKGEYHDLS
jgi:type II pantothenate kinase